MKSLFPRRAFILLVILSICYGHRDAVDIEKRVDVAYRDPNSITGVPLYDLIISVMLCIGTIAFMVYVAISTESTNPSLRRAEL